MSTPKAGSAHVVVGVNGTADSLAAVRTGAREAALRQVPLRVVHALSWPGRDSAGAALPYDVLRRQADDLLARAVATAARSAPGVRVTGQLTDGLPSRVLLQQSRTAALLVLGGEGAGATVRLPSDSVLVQCVARARCPAMVVRGAGPPAGPVLVGVDGSATAVLAVRWAAAEAARRHAALDVVHVTDGPGSAGRAVLDAAVAACPDPAAVRPRLLPGEPAAALLRAASQAQLLVIGPRGTGSRVGAQLGSVAWSMLRASSRPTVLVHGTTFGIRAATGTVRSAAG